VSRSVLRLWLPVAVWATLIFALSSIPDLGTALAAWDLLLRKLAHAAEYAELGKRDPRERTLARLGEDAVVVRTSAELVKTAS